MITEDYCSFEVSKLLRKKGFDEPCTELNKLCLKDGEKPVLKVTHQKAMKWLREVHQIFIRVIQSRLEYCSCEIYYDRVRCYNFMESFDSHEQAVETALKYCLENLI